MLAHLHVKNLALIEEIEVEFGPGLNILTGGLTVRCSNQLSYGAIFNLSCHALSLTTPLL